MPRSTRSNKETQPLFSSDPASLEHLIRMEVQSSSIDNNTCSSLDFCQLPSTQGLVSSTDTRSPPSTEDTHLPPTDIFHPTSIDTSVLTSIDTEPRDMVATLILVRDERVHLHDQEGHLRNAAADRFGVDRIALVSIDARLRTSIDGFQSKSIDRLSRSSIDDTYRFNRILQCREDSDSRGVCSKTPHPPSPVYVKIDQHSDTPVDRQHETAIDRQPPAPIDRGAPLIYRVQMPKIYVARLNALRPKPKPSDNPPETIMIPSDDAADLMEVDMVPMGRTMRKRKEKVAKHLKRGASEKEMESFQKRVFKIPLEKPFEEAYFIQRLGIDHQKSTDAPRDELVDSSPEDWENDSQYNPIMAVNNATPETQKGKGTRFSRISEADIRAAIDIEIQESIDRDKKKSIDVNVPPSIDRRPEFGRRAFDRFGTRKFYWEEKEEYGVYRDDQGCVRDVDGHIINVSKEDIRKLMERASRDEHNYICLPEHASSFT
ncbi:hypothetical protein F2Q69_00013640 [Brassica cretica]|uniref:Uncharacterized protein n=1 Tax=Brassica cretica TaxID=69181 RepID=A0A8S9QZ83_BRACR|nr:hypothetical protein F2Q69_00013640 [Brassica cretica]